MKRFKTALMTLAVALGILSAPLTVCAGSDNTPPELNAAVNNGLLTVNAVDESGIEVITVNGYEFFNPKDGKLSVRLEKFEAGVKEFTISATDKAGNKTQDYIIPNPYWSDPNNTDDNNTEDPAEGLPADASATDPSSATGEVTEHDFYYLADNPGYSREFYTIETETGKVFYLIIVNEDDNRTVHFLTDINENDLLNTTENNSETLPKNSIGADSQYTSVGLPPAETTAESKPTESVKPTAETKPSTQPEQTVAEDKETPKETTPEAEAEEPAPKKSNPLILYGVIGAVFFGFAYYFKIVKKKKGGADEFVEDEEEAEIEDDIATEEALAEAGEDDDEASSDEFGYFAKDQSDEEFFNSLSDEDMEE